MSRHPAVQLLDLAVDLATEPYAVAAAALAGAPGVRVRADGAAVELIQIDLDAGPTRAELEASLGPARELPRPAVSGFALLAFAPRGGCALFAHVDAATGGASRLVVRRDARYAAGSAV